MPSSRRLSKGLRRCYASVPSKVLFVSSGGSPVNAKQLTAEDSKRTLARSSKSTTASQWLHELDFGTSRHARLSSNIETGAQTSNARGSQEKPWSPIAKLNPEREGVLLQVSLPSSLASWKHYCEFCSRAIC
eukprot:1463322-Amphidinium_carterae.1